MLAAMNIHRRPKYQFAERAFGEFTSESPSSGRRVSRALESYVYEIKTKLIIHSAVSFRRSENSGGRKRCRDVRCLVDLFVVFFST